MKKSTIISILILSFINLSAQQLIYNTQSESTFSNEINESKDLYTLLETTVNSKYSDIGTAFFINKVIMYSSRKTGSLFAGKDNANNTPYQSLYCVDIDINGNLARPNFFAYALNGKGNECGISFSPDLKVAYISKSNEENTNNFQLYKFDFDGVKTWINEVSLDLNSKNYSVENPFVSSNGKKIYFSSNMPGGFGGFDIYEADLNEEGLPINIKNLGSTINTNKDEKFPFITSKDHKIYFSSNGHSGYGNFDVFVSNIKTASYSTPINLGKTFNTQYDEIAYIVDSSNRGFVSSNRINETSFDIYKVETQNNPNSLEGIVYSKESKLLLPNTDISLIDDEGKVIDNQKTDENGQFKFSVEPLDKYTIAAKKEGYSDFQKTVKTAIGVATSNIELSAKKVEIINNTLVVENIYFDLNKFTIKTESTLSLNKIVNVLNENPTMKILINAHTDAQGSEKLNLTLSNNRALSAKKYLISKGIESNRIISKGFGESRLFSNCTSNCTEEQYIADRRIEFIIQK